MKFLGNISHLSNSGRLIARSSQSPPSGAFVFDKDKRKIGKIVEIFGPTKDSYISIGIFKSLTPEDYRDRYGEDLFMSNNLKNKKSQRRNKKHKKDNKKNPRKNPRNNSKRLNRKNKNRDNYRF